MRSLLFFLFKTFRSIERPLWGKGLRRIPGVTTLYRAWLSFCDLIYDTARPKGIVLIEVQGNRMYVNTIDRGIAPMLLVDGVMEKYETELFKQMVKEGMVVVDIGANIGYYTLIGAKLVGKRGIVYAFEPLPSNYELLCKNIEVNGYTNVVPVQKAVSNKQGKAKFWFSQTDLATSSFSRANASLFSIEKSPSCETCEVETITLDEFFENTVKNTKVDVIKIDTQGAEGLIIDGAKKILKSDNLKITMEFWPEGLRNLGTDPLELLFKLQECGLKIKRITERKQALEPVENIAKFCRKAKPREEFNLLLEK